LGRKGFLITAFLILLVSAAMAESNASDTSADYAAPIRCEHWVVGVLASGGSGLFDRDNVQFVRGGVRAGRVLTGELGHGVLRGTFEADVEVMPVDYVLWSDYRNVYGVGVNPVVLKWNFTSGHKMIPYLLAQGGVLWSSHNVPPGDTSHFNFLSGPGIGFNYFAPPTCRTHRSGRTIPA
jgi:lipid A 3-O-deacylase